MYKIEVIADNSGEWVGNGQTFPTVGKARCAAIDLWQRWTAVQKWRVVNCETNEVESDSEHRE